MFLKGQLACCSPHLLYFFFQSAAWNVDVVVDILDQEDKDHTLKIAYCSAERNRATAVVDWSAKVNPTILLPESSIPAM